MAGTQSEFHSPLLSFAVFAFLSKVVIYVSDRRDPSGGNNITGGLRGKWERHEGIRATGGPELTAHRQHHTASF